MGGSSLIWQNWGAVIDRWQIKNQNWGGGGGGKSHSRYPNPKSQYPDPRERGREGVNGVGHDPRSGYGGVTCVSTQEFQMYDDVLVR